MTPESVAAMIRAKGEPIRLRRLTSVQNVFFDLDTFGKLSGYAPEMIAGAIQEGDRELRVGDVDIRARQWPGPPRKGDLAFRADGKPLSVDACETKSIGDRAVMHILRVRG